MHALVETPLSPELATAAVAEQLAEVIPFPATAEVSEHPEAELLFWIHAAAYDRARADSSGNRVLTHGKDESFRYIVGYDASPETGALTPFIKLSDNGQPAFVYSLPELGAITRHVEVNGQRYPDEKNPVQPNEIVAIGNILLQGFQGYELHSVVANIV